MKDLRMKYWYYILILISLFYAMSSFGQDAPVSEDFNTQPNTWVRTNGAGYMLIGAGNYALTTNVGTTPYPNDDTITMTSPIYNLTNCVGGMVVSFLISGRIENNFDVMHFEYSTNNGVTYTVVQTFTGIQNNVTYINSTIPNTANRFRFRLVTDCSINAIRNNGIQCSLGGTATCTPDGGCTGQFSVYYYDIDNFVIVCDGYLPIELKEFKGTYNGNNHLSWVTETERDNDYFTLEHSIDGENWNTINTQSGAGTTSQKQYYNYIHKDYTNVINYYRLSQTDYDGTKEVFKDKIVAIDNRNTRYVVKIINVLGQEVNKDAKGLKFYVYNDGTSEKLID